MHLQRVGELRAYSTQHIKWTTEGAVNRLEIILVFCNATQALIVRDMLVSCKEEHLLKQGGTANSPFVLVMEGVFNWLMVNS